MIFTHKTTRTRQKAQAIVELALILPILLLLLMGIVELGRIFMAQHTITNATREGARIGSLPSSTTSDAHSTVSTYMNAAGLSGDTNVSMSNVGPTVNPGATTSVTVEHQLPILVGNLIPGLGDSILLSHSTVMRHE